MDIDVAKNRFGTSKSIIAIKLRGSKKASKRAKVATDRTIGRKADSYVTVIQKRVA